ncbi:hypothetical protein [Micromonospora sp. WMMB235]|uniref:hypothetical protein n=1 Tax=Micromonospora sp. WMMB235 TaxID=1172030 RepID=UPI000AA3C022|nr:hypothetical protein [Micromonospora sp. WMMB235]
MSCAHIADALDSGRDTAEILAGLGAPSAVAGQAREELGLPVRDGAERAARTLSVVAVAAGVLIAVCVSFLLPSAVPVDPLGAGSGEQGVVRRFGPGIALLTLLPALLVAAPLVLRGRARGAARFAGAAALALFACASGEIGLYYVPLALVAGAAAVVPWAMRRGAGGRWWRYLTGGFVAMPGVLVTVATVGGSVGIGWAGAALWIARPLVVGALVMVSAMAERGFLFAAFWLFGGLYLAIGAGAYAASLAAHGDPAATPGPSPRPAPAPGA